MSQTAVENGSQIVVAGLTHDLDVRLRRCRFGAFVLEKEVIGLADISFSLAGANLAAFDWIVACVRSEDAHAVLTDGQPTGLVSFRRGFLLFKGDRRDAISAMLLHGVPPSMAARIYGLPHKGNIARSADNGVSVGSHGSWALTGFNGVSISGDRGVAIAGNGGRAVVGDDGIAIARGAGTAEAGRQRDPEAVSVAVAGGYKASASTGDAGIAIATDVAYALAAHGYAGRTVAVCGAKTVHIGAYGIAVIGGPRSRATFVRAEPRSLVIYRPDPDPADRSLVYAIRLTGSDAVEMFAHQGQLIGVDDWRATGDESYYLLRDERPKAFAEGELIDSPSMGPDVSKSTSWWEAARFAFPEVHLSMDEPKEDEVVIACRGLRLSPADADYPAYLGPVFTADFATGTVSPFGFLGLTGNSGDVSILRDGAAADADTGDIGERWQIVFAPKIATTPLADGRGIGFKQGRIVCNGPAAAVLRGLSVLGVHLSGVAGLIDDAGEGEDAASSALWCRAGKEGCARGTWLGEAGERGVASADIAIAGPEGLALSHSEGRAIADRNGIAIVPGKRYGHASAGSGGIAIAAGRYASASVGPRGVAIADRAAAGSHGVAIGDVVTAGEFGIACGEKLAGGPGCLLVARGRHPNGEDYAVAAVANERGVVAGRQYVLVGDQLIPAV